jgi:hypothetical protein
MIKVVTKLTFYRYTQLRPGGYRVLCFIALQPELSIAFEIDSCKGYPNMDRNIVHGKVLFTFLLPNSRVLTTKFGKFNLRQLILSIVMRLIKTRGLLILMCRNSILRVSCLEILFLTIGQGEVEGLAHRASTLE